LWDTPQPFSPWLPGATGISAAIVISLSAFAAGARNTGIAMDELYRLEWGRAVQFSYWLGLVLFIVASFAVARGWVGQSTGIAAFGTAYGASPLLLFCVITLRG
ncbi:MAG: hypothetical protein WBC85_07795, partial [Planktotalea sp.]|uniref:hypothetical protein n=1 Tax=Planktotalea sp. TaxID=2029877 RepID=UPI003C77FA39